MTERLKIYISGQMNGLTEEQYSQLFFNKYIELTFKYPDAIIINPVFLNYELERVIELKYNRKPTYKEYLINDMQYLSYCNAIYMLSNYECSKGAMSELKFAEACKYQIFYEDADDM